MFKNLKKQQKKQQKLPRATPFPSRQDALRRAFEFRMQSGLQGDYYEFGLYKGASFCMAIEAEHHFTTKYSAAPCEAFFGFDSFQGLPDILCNDTMHGYDAFQKGGYACPRQELQGIFAKHKYAKQKNIVLIEGFYNDTLSSAEIAQKMGSSKAAVVHIDCDLYSSARDVLNFLTHRMEDGVVMLFDDWFCYRGNPAYGVNRAFREWLADGAWQANEYFHYGWAGKAFILNQKVAS